MTVQLNFGKPAIDKIEAMKRTFGVATEAEVVSKAIELARIVAEEADAAHTVVLAGKNGTPIRVHWAG
jgi:hypothetical protein